MYRTTARENRTFAMTEKMREESTQSYLKNREKEYLMKKKREGLDYAQEKDKCVFSLSLFRVRTQGFGWLVLMSVQFVVLAVLVALARVLSEFSLRFRRVHSFVVGEWFVVRIAVMCLLLVVCSNSIQFVNPLGCLRAYSARNDKAEEGGSGEPSERCQEPTRGRSRGVDESPREARRGKKSG